MCLLVIQQVAKFVALIIMTLRIVRNGGVSQNCHTALAIFLILKHNRDRASINFFEIRIIQGGGLILFLVWFVWWYLLLAFEDHILDLNFQGWDLQIVWTKHINLIQIFAGFFQEIFLILNCSTFL